MKYLCLIYYDEQRVDALTDEQWQALVARCLSCGEEIPAKRLELDPATPVCVDCAGD